MTGFYGTDFPEPLDPGPHWSDAPCSPSAAALPLPRRLDAPRAPAPARRVAPTAADETGVGATVRVPESDESRRPDETDQLDEPHVEGAVDVGLWDERPILRHVREFALARMAAPAALLGVVLIRVADLIPPSVMLPPIIGGPAGLNLFAALVGPSGAGKGAAVKASDAAIRWPRPTHRVNLGSGEGMAHAYAHREGVGKAATVVRDRDAVMFELSEVDTLAATVSRQGSTLDATLRSVYSGERLGSQNADRARTVPVEAGSYRATLIVGVQPERARALLAGADGGTPQRFIWLPAASAEVTEQPPPEPEPLPLRLPRWPLAGSGRCLIGLPDEAVAAIRAAHVARMRGEGHALDGHALLTRTKLAAVLAVIEGRLEVDLDDWRIAGRIMRLSDATRAHIEGRLAAATERENVSRGRREGARAAAAADEQASRHEARVAARLRARLKAAGAEGLTRGELNRALASRDREHLDGALVALDPLVDEIDGRFVWGGARR